MAEDQAYQYRLLHEDDVGEDADSPMINSPFLHHRDGNDNSRAQYVNGKHPQWRWSRAGSVRRRRLLPGTLLWIR